MPNLTGAHLLHTFGDQNPDVFIETDDATEEVAVVEKEVYNGLHLAHAHAAPDIEFGLVPIPASTSFKLLNYDASRSRLSIAADAGSLLISSVNLAAIAPAAWSSGASAWVGALPGFVIPDIGSGQLPFDFHTQSEIWVWNNNTQTQRVWYAVERYASS